MARGRGIDRLLTCHWRENDIDTHLTSPQMTLLDETLGFIFRGNEDIFVFLCLFFSPVPPT